MAIIKENFGNALADLWYSKGAHFTDFDYKVDSYYEPLKNLIYIKETIAKAKAYKFGKGSDRVPTVAELSELHRSVFMEMEINNQPNVLQLKGKVDANEGDKGKLMCDLVCYASIHHEEASRVVDNGTIVPPEGYLGKSKQERKAWIKKIYPDQLMFLKKLNKPKSVAGFGRAGNLVEVGL